MQPDRGVEEEAQIRFANLAPEWQQKQRDASLNMKFLGLAVVPFSPAAKDAHPDLGLLFDAPIGLHARMAPLSAAKYLVSGLPESTWVLREGVGVCCLARADDRTDRTGNPRREKVGRRKHLSRAMRKLKVASDGGE